MNVLKNLVLIAAVSHVCLLTVPLPTPWSSSSPTFSLIPVARAQGEQGEEQQQEQEQQGGATGKIRPAIFSYGRDVFPFFNLSSGSNASEWNGMDVDIVKYLCNNTLSDTTPYLDCVNLDQVYITSSMDERLTAVIDGKADFSIGAISVTPEREELVDFIRPLYFSVGSYLFGPKDSSIKSWGDLKGLIFCTYEGYHAAERVKEAYGAKDIVYVGSFSEAGDAVANGTCAAFLVDQHKGPADSTLVVLLEHDEGVGTTPFGIAVSKNASAELVSSLTAAAVSMLWDGNQSALWEIAMKTVFSPDYADEYENSKSEMQFAISAVTGFLTESGNKLDFSNMPTNKGSLAVQAPGTPAPYQATIAVYQSDSLPLALTEGEKTFLDEGSEWRGMEIEIAKAICSSSVVECVDVVVAETLADRITLVEEGQADISIGSIVVTQDRLEQAPFVQPFYFSAGPALYMPESAPDRPKDSTLEYLNGKNVCTVTDSAYNEPAEANGATLVIFETQAEAEAAIYKGECIGLLWDSHVYLEGLVEVAHDVSMDSPMSIVVSPNAPAGLYSFLSSLLADLMSDCRSSKLLEWEREYGQSATPNKNLYAVTDAITNFAPTYSLLDDPDAGGSGGDDASNDNSASSSGFGLFGMIATPMLIGGYLVLL